MDQDAFKEFFEKNFMGMRSDFLHPYAGLKFKAYLDTLNYIEANMLDQAIACRNQNEIFNHVMSYVKPDGIVAEFGVKTGTSITKIAGKDTMRKRQIFGFDSFQGLPDNWYGTRAKKGKLTTFGETPKLPKNVSLVTGWFKDSLPEFLKEQKDDFALMHIDCDIYQSTVDIFTPCKDRIKKGTVIIFDEYFNYPGWRQHEYKAFQEFCQKEKKSYSYLAYAHTQVAVVIN